LCHRVAKITKKEVTPEGKSHFFAIGTISWAQLRRRRNMGRRPDFVLKTMRAPGQGATLGL
jgi:hypothetical protein